jgi:hypothetical protein
MRGYFGIGQLSAAEKSDILNQHKSLYNGYQTMQPKVSNTQPLTVYDFAGDKEGLVVNNKGEVKKYTNMGINEQVEQKEVCDECGAMIMDGMCSECNYGHMEEDFNEGSEMCEQCGGTMKENVCEQCGSGEMEEESGHLDDIYKVKDLNLKKGDYDYVEGGGNDYGTFEGMHKNLYKEQDDDDDDFMDYEPSYAHGVYDPDNEDDGFEDLNVSENSKDEIDEIDVKNLIKGKKYRYKIPSYQADVEFDDEKEYPDGKNMYGFKDKTSGYSLGKKGVEDFISILDDEDNGIYEQGGNTDDMDVDDVEPAYDFESNGPMAGGDVYPVNELDEDDMYGYEPEKDYETMESAWAEDELEEQPDISGVQGIYGDMDPAYDFDSDGPGKAGPYQEFSYESELDEGDESNPFEFINRKLVGLPKLGTKEFNNLADFYFSGNPNKKQPTKKDFGGDDSEEEDFGFATHSGDFEGDDSEDEDFGFATHSGDFEGDDSEDDEWEEIDVDMKESFITQKNKITEMFNRIKKYN